MRNFCGARSKKCLQLLNATIDTKMMTDMMMEKKTAKNGTFLKFSSSIDKTKNFICGIIRKIKSLVTPLLQQYQPKRQWSLTGKRWKRQFQFPSSYSPLSRNTSSCLSTQKKSSFENKKKRREKFSAIWTVHKSLNVSTKTACDWFSTEKKN